MRKINRILLVTILIIGSLINFTGCNAEVNPVELSKPIIQALSNNGRIIIMAIDDPNASSYEFYFYSGEYYNDTSIYAKIETDNNFLDVTDIIQGSQIYYFYAKAIGNQTKYLNSLKSSIVSYDNSDALPAPYLSLTNSTLSWTAVVDNNGYEIYKNGVLIDTINETNYDISSYITELIEYDFEVKALGSEGNYLYKDSLNSNIVTYEEHLYFDPPTNLQVIQNESGEDYLTWNEVEGATGYTVLVGNAIAQMVDTNELLLSSVLTQAKEYSFKVKVNQAEVLRESEYSDTLLYNNYVQLEKPIIESASRNGNDVVVSWQPVEHAQSYTLIVNGEVYEDELGVVVIYENQVLIPGTLEKQEGGFDLEVYANAFDFYLQSQTSDIFAYGGIDQLAAPTNLAVEKTDDVITVSWDEEPEAIGYCLAVNNNVIELPVQTSYEIQDLIQPEEVVNLRIKAIGQGFITDSNYSDATIYNNTSSFTIIGYTDQYFYYNKLYDYNITSQEELDALIAYAISYHLDDVTAYINYNLSSEQLTLADSNSDGSASETEIIRYKQNLSLLAYTETHTLTYSMPQEVGYSGKEYKFAFTYDYGMDPTLVSNDPDAYTQYESFQPEVSPIGRDDTYNNFAPENALIEVEVYNSENLFMAINSGGKPKFMIEDSQAEQVYEAAKNILRQIIDDSMSDYEKMLAIYDWVSYNTIYDRYVYQLATQDTTGWTQEQIDNLDISIPQYRVFYLEGVLLDGTAVCDGIAKTVALLASMEGIEIVKINGSAGVNRVGHAWNKVFIEVGDEPAAWYAIDATWGDGTTNLGDGEQEYIRHDRYFLVQDSDIESTHFAESPFNPIANTDYDYFTMEEYALGYDHYIESQEALNHLVAYMVYNNVQGVEVYVDFPFGTSLNQEIIIALNETGVTGSQYVTWTNGNANKIMINIIAP